MHCYGTYHWKLFSVWKIPQNFEISLTGFRWRVLLLEQDLLILLRSWVLSPGLCMGSCCPIFSFFWHKTWLLIFKRRFFFSLFLVGNVFCLLFKTVYCPLDMHQLPLLFINNIHFRTIPSKLCFKTVVWKKSIWTPLVKIL